jgi:hypothetical protein
MNRLTYRDARLADLPFIVGLIIEDGVVPTGDDPSAGHSRSAASAFSTNRP